MTRQYIIVPADKTLKALKKFPQLKRFFWDERRRVSTNPRALSSSRFQELRNYARNQKTTQTRKVLQWFKPFHARNDRNEPNSHNFITSGLQRPVLAIYTATLRDSLAGALMYVKLNSSRSIQARVLNFGRVLPIYSLGNHLFPYQKRYLRVHPTDL